MADPLNRRQFCLGLTLATAGFLTKDLLLAPPARADSNYSSGYGIPQNIEKYVVVVPRSIARRGGKQSVTLYSGESYDLSIPTRSRENSMISVAGIGQDGNDAEFELHTLYDLQTRIGLQIYDEIENAQLISEASQTKCKDVYESIEDCKFIEEVEALELLDYIVSSSRLDEEIRDRYELASNNTRLVGIKKVLEEALQQSTLSGSEKTQLRGTFELVKAGQPIPDFKVLTQLDSIVLSSSLTDSIKQSYVLGSAVSRAATVDYLIVEQINGDSRLTNQQKDQYLSLYREVRDGTSSSDASTLKKQLDPYILKNDNLPLNAKVVYQEARKKNLDEEQKLEENINQLAQQKDEFQELLETAKENGGRVVPQTTRLLAQLGVEAGTGVSISTLSGAAATNATLAWLGGGSVASGGFGMLGGLAVATGGAALIGAAGIISLAVASQMDAEDQKNLGIAIGGGTIVGATALLTAWTAASALGVAGSLSGAAAISTMLAALGGVSVVTGGTALVASGAAYLIWSFLKSNKKREQGFLEQLETRIYTLTAEPSPGSFADFVAKNIRPSYSYEEGFAAPYIPLDKLHNALKKWLVLDWNEKVIALIDTSIWDDGKSGIALTDKRIIWKVPFEQSLSLSYQKLDDTFNQTVLTAMDVSNSRNKLENLIDLSNILDESQRQEFIQVLEKLGQEYNDRPLIS
ncbi:hypothetical protein [Lyngbya sp. CCY1209]|uniref:hypothetical protein n=1 Tax=Lyngbya sp. CCY1209 TaxID=2886103 RepID=UPI002D1FD90B|nr:hypothetical protein [Lyngbya sp. CCY1209]MEB3887175.1 hypothetical protein [Lyngbya sp. CCY1209]